MDARMVKYSQICNVIYQINNRKDKNQIIMKIDGEKAFEKVLYPFLIKTLRQVGIEGAYLNIIKTIYMKLTDNIVLKRQK